MKELKLGNGEELTETFWWNVLASQFSRTNTLHFEGGYLLHRYPSLVTAGFGWIDW